MRHLPLNGALLLSLAAAALATAQPATARRPVTIDDIMSMRTVAAPAISPDGREVLYTIKSWVPASSPNDRTEAKDARMEGHTHIWEVSATGGPTHQFTFSDSSEMDPAWSPDGRKIAFLSPRGDAEPNGREHIRQLWVMRADGGEAWQLTHAPEKVRAFAWGPASQRIAFTTADEPSAAVRAARARGDDPEVFEGNFERVRLWIVDVASAKTTELAGHAGFSIRGKPSWSPTGTRIAVSAAPTPMTRDNRTDVYLVDVAAGTARRVTTNLGPDDSPIWSPDGATIAYLETPNASVPNGDGLPPQSISNTHLMLYDVARGTSRDVSAGFDSSPESIAWTPDSRRILFSAGRQVYREMYAYDIASGRDQRLTTGRVIRFGTLSREGGRAAFVMQSGAEPPDVYVSGLTFASPVKLTTVNPQTAHFALGREEVIRWKSTDGRGVQGILQLPVGYRPGHRYPLLVVAHGGPTGAYTDTFRVGEFDGGQLWAGEGWAVLYPNPRGSTNYGQAFMRANIGDWGGGDYHDIMSGVDAVIARGIADPARMAFMGWSYGGYMTCWTVSQTTRFKAAMMGAGLTDLVSMYGTTDIPNYLEAFFHGTPDGARLPLYRARSGLSFVDDVTTPLLILQGGADVRVPTSQSMEFFRALKDRGKTVELVYYPREHHGFVEYYHLKDRIERLHAWITRYTLGSGKKTAGS